MVSGIGPGTGYCTLGRVFPASLMPLWEGVCLSGQKQWGTDWVLPNIIGYRVSDTCHTWDCVFPASLGGSVPLNIIPTQLHIQRLCEFLPRLVRRGQEDTN